MSASHLDLPVLMSADQIRRREFVAVRRGYDPGQVRDFLEQVAEQVQQLEGMLREARLEADAAVRAASGPRTDPYEELARRLATVLRTADEEAERIRRDARREAERILAEARADADRIRVDAQSTAEEIRAEAEAVLREAREQADRTIAGLATKRDELVEQLAAMQERLVGVARELESTISAPRERTIVLGEAGPAEDAGNADRGSAQAPRSAAGGSASGGPDGSDDPDELGEEARTALLDASFGDPWGEAGSLEVPEIPPLDLDWGELPEDD